MGRGKRVNPGRAVRTPGVIACLIAGLVTTVAVAWAAALVPLTPLGYSTQYVATAAGLWRERGGIERLLIPPTSGTVAYDGDHLQPWLLRLRRPGATRTIWFEKGRIYNHPNMGPPGGSSAAVACWSLAISTRSNPHFNKGDLELPPSLDRERRRQNPRTTWGVAEDRRGWPVRAMRWQAVADLYRIKGDGPMFPDANAIYRFRYAVPLDRNPNSPQSLGDLRALPLMPEWPGLAVDTVFWAGAWWMLLLAPRLVRVRWRRRRGRCPRCGYDLAGALADGCPECGWMKFPEPSAAD